MTIRLDNSRVRVPGSRRRVVRDRIPFTRLIDAHRPGWGPVLPVALRWTSTDPHAVELTFPAGPDRCVVWLVGRDLLAAGVSGPAGLGDVAVLPDLRSPAYRELVLSGSAGRAGFRFPIARLIAFLERIGETDGGAR